MMIMVVIKRLVMMTVIIKMTSTKLNLMMMKVQSWFAAASNFLGGGEIFISGIIVRAAWAPFRGGMQSGNMRMVEIRMMLIILIVTRALYHSFRLSVKFFQLKSRRLN